MPHRPGPVAGPPAPGPAPAQAPGSAPGQEDPFGSLLWEGFALNDPAVFWELSGDLFAIYDSQACFVDVNPAWERLLGWQTSQLIGRPGMSFVHPDDRPGAAAIAEQARTAGGRFSDAELRLRAADGSYHWVSCSAYTEGEGWCTVSRDVSERKRAEAARDEAERRTTEAYTMTGLSTWRWEPANDAVALSGELEQEGAARGLRMTLEDTLRLVAPSHRDKIRQAVKRVAAGLDEGYCIRYPTAPGAEQPRWLESRAAAVRAGDGTVYAVQGTTQDVTEAELVRDELEGSRNFNQATLDSLDAHVAVLDEHGTIVFVNGAWSRFLAANGSCAAGVGESYLRACDGDPGARAVATALRRMLAGSLERFELEYPCHSPAEERWFHLTAAPLRADGPMRVVVQHHDITERMQAERAERMRSRLLDKVGAAVVATDLHGKVTGWSNGAEALYGWSEVEALGQPVADLTVPAELRGGMEAFMSRVTRDGHWDVDLELVRKDGSRFTGFVSSSLLSNDEGATVGLVGVSVDATERVAAQDALRETSDYLAAITDGMGEGLIAINDRGDVLYMNPEAEQRLGWTSEDLLGQNLHEKTHYRRADGSPFPIGECPLMNARFEGKAVRVEEDVFYRRDGSPVSISYSATPFEQADGATGAVVVFADITERKRAEWALRASEAQLKAIVENTSAAIYVKRRGDYRYELANPELESVMGVERGWIVGKTDADFLPPEAVEALRATDRRVIEQGEEVTVEEVIPVGDQLLTYLSMKFPLMDEHGRPRAVCGVSTNITERKRREAELQERLEWEARIRTAVNDDRLLVYAQPILDLRSGAVVQEELLVRMQGARGPADVIPPGEFLPQAERFGLVGQIDRFMVQRGIHLASQGRPVQINLSGRSIVDRALTREIERELRATGADPSRIVFEITETAAVVDLDAAREFSERITRLGCKVALDDFGTGYGALTYQRQLSVHFLKIDISFVSGMATSAADQQVVRSIVKLAKDYGQQTIAEGVEDEETLELLRTFGVDFAQGYHIGRPAPVS